MYNEASLALNSIKMFKCKYQFGLITNCHQIKINVKCEPKILTNKISSVKLPTNSEQLLYGLDQYLPSEILISPICICSSAGLSLAQHFDCVTPLWFSWWIDVSIFNFWIILSLNRKNIPPTIVEVMIKWDAIIYHSIVSFYLHLRRTRR